MYFTQGILVAQDETPPLSSNHIDLLSNGIIWKSGVYTEKSETPIFLGTGLCSLL